MWVAVGQGTYTIAYSSDGITWNGVTDSSTNIFTTAGYDVAYNGTMWVAVGEGTTYSIAYSSDGITWNGVTDSSTAIFTSSGRDIAWNGTMWVAVGEGTTYSIAYSSDGIIWNGVTDSGVNIFTLVGFGVAWNNVVIPSLTLNKNGYGLSNKLDIVADKYYNKGYTNLTLSVNEIPNPTASITTNGSTTLTPQFTNGTTVTINGSSTINGQTIVSNTTYTVSPKMTTRYTLVVTNSIGVQQSASVTINVAPPEPSGFWGYFRIYNETAVGSVPKHFHATFEINTIDIEGPIQINGGANHTFTIPIEDRAALPTSIFKLKFTFQSGATEVDPGGMDGFDIVSFTNNSLQAENTMSMMINDLNFIEEGVLRVDFIITADP